MSTKTRTAKSSQRKKGPVTGPSNISFAKGPTGHGYIAILHATLAARNENDAKYSMRTFASDLGVESGALSRILSGQRPLSYKTALRMLDNLGYKGDERAAFLASVEDQARASDMGEVSIERSQRQITSVAVERSRLSPEELLNHELVKEARAKIDRCVIKNYSNKVIFVTTAVQGAEVDRNFLSAMETFIEKRDAELIITTTKAHLKPLGEEEYPLDDIIYERYQDCVYKQVELNKHLSVVDLDVRPYVTDPLAGLAELGAEDGRSYIIAHTQQRMKTYPNGMHALPRLQQCTGAMTLPLYRNNKSGLMADKRHVIGGLIIEIRRNVFHVRVVQADADGSFVDLGTRYNPNGTRVFERPEALIRGDDHVGFGDIKANIALDEVTAKLKPKKIVVHDLFDSASISHHRAHSIKARLEVPEGIKYLDLELATCTKFLQDLNDKKPKDSEILVIAANHNEALHRYLNEGRYVEDMPNYKKGVELAYQYHVNGIDPLVHGVDPEQKLATWVTRTEQAIRVEGIAISNHGDKGPNGSRGSVRGDAVSYGRSSSGHSHSPEIWRGASRVGTSSLLDMDYTAGSPSSWAHCFELIYKGKDGVGLRQLVFAIEGKWCMDGALETDDTTKPTKGAKVTKITKITKVTKVAKKSPPTRTVVKGAKAAR